MLTSMQLAATVQERIRAKLPDLRAHFPLPAASEHYSALIQHLGLFAHEDPEQIPKDPTSRQQWVSYAERDLTVAIEFLRQQSDVTPATADDLDRLAHHFATRT